MLVCRAPGPVSDTESEKWDLLNTHTRFLIQYVLNFKGNLASLSLAAVHERNYPRLFLSFNTSILRIFVANHCLGGDNNVYILDNITSVLWPASVWEQLNYIIIFHLSHLAPSMSEVSGRDYPYI